MSNISDRQIAKVLVKVSALMGATLVAAGIPQNTVDLLASEFTKKASNSNDELRQAVMTIVRETTVEWNAEKEGTAQSIFRNDADEPKSYEASGTARHENWD